MKEKFKIFKQKDKTLKKESQLLNLFQPEKINKE